MKRHHELGNSYNEKYLIGDGLQFRGFGSHYQGRKHSCMQANVVLERQLRFYIGISRQKEETLTH